MIVLVKLIGISFAIVGPFARPFCTPESRWFEPAGRFLSMIDDAFTAAYSNRNFILRLTMAALAVRIGSGN